MKPISSKTRFLLAVPLALGLLGCSTSSAEEKGHSHSENAEAEPAVANSYAVVDFSQPLPSIAEPTGTSSLGNVKLLETGGTIYSPTYEARVFSQGGQGLTFEFSLSKPTMVQLALRNAYVLNTGLQSDVSIIINGKTLTTLNVANASWHENVIDIPAKMLNSGTNKVDLILVAGTANWFLQEMELLPRNLYAVNGELNTTIYSQFGITDDLQNFCVATDNCDTVWTRSYGLASTAEMIPGPTLYYNPGDLLTVNMVNKMYGETLDQFEQGEANNMPGANGPNSDEVLANLGDQIRQEVNIPHNLNNTNLHVHGLHVDPEKDDVTIVIVPEDEAGTVDEYDAPHHLPTSPEDLSDLNEGSVADQPVKPGRWSYQYRIPENHLPGTHWFHPHKHGSTAAQVENGMAGSMVIQEPSELAMFPGFENSEWSARYDQVMMIQQIANYGLQQGQGGGKQAVANSVAPVTVVNAVHQGEHKLAPGQVVRWRFVNAGANHRAFNHMWLGRDTGLKDANNNPVYVSEPIWSVAFDGITLSEKATATAEAPFLLAPGNRADVVIQVPEDAENGASFKLFKYYPTSISIVDPSYFEGGTEGKTLSDYLSWDCSTYKSQTTPCSSGSEVSPLQPAFAPTSNPYLFLPNTETVIASNNAFDENFDGYKFNWMQTNNTATSTPVVPIIKVTDNNGMLDISHAKVAEFPTDGNCSSSDGCDGKWQPQFDGFGGGAVVAEELLSITADTSMTRIGPDAIPEDSYL
ncbi:MAG: multicopper oxidase domain-containing protein, partial [Pseudomonadota bacterium]